MISAFRCPEYDRLSRSLVNAYRDADVRDVFCLSNGEDSSIQAVAMVHLEMLTHKSKCPLCEHELIEFKSRRRSYDKNSSQVKLGRLT